MDKLFAFYGTLRLDQPNYNRFQLDKYGKFIETTKINNLALVDVNGWYPMAFKEQDSFIVVDVIEISNKDIINTISRMEINAGYIEHNISVNGNDCTIFIGSAESLRFLTSPKPIPSGDWVQYNTKLNDEGCTNFTKG